MLDNACNNSVIAQLGQCTMIKCTCRCFSISCKDNVCACVCMHANLPSPVGGGERGMVVFSIGAVDGRHTHMHTKSSYLQDSIM